MFESINRAKLSRDEREEIQILEHGFGTPFWAFIKERATARHEALVHGYDACVDSQQLGIVQGLRRAYAELINLADSIENEYAVVQEEREINEEALKPEEPEFDDVW